MENQNSLKNTGGKLQGLVERITFTSEKDGYSVVKIKAPGYRDLVTVVGNFVSLCPGETLLMEGTWSAHARFGRQFRVDRYETTAPSTVLGIRKYLGSGLIRGIGPKMAERIVKRFAEKTLDIIESQIERLLEIDGIGKYRVGQIQKAWGEQKEIRTLMIFLRSNGASAALASRIFKNYGRQSVEIVRDNPYRLAMDITGVGFLTSDKLAVNLGFAADSPLRAEAGILFVLHESAEEGHVYMPRSLLMELSRNRLQIETHILEEALSRLRADMRIKEERLPPAASGQFGEERAIYLRPMHASEVGAAARFDAIQRYRRLQPRIDSQEALNWVRGRLNFSLAPLQEEAVKLVPPRKSYRNNGRTGYRQNHPCPGNSCHIRAYRGARQPGGAHRPRCKEALRDHRASSRDDSQAAGIQSPTGRISAKRAKTSYRRPRDRGRDFHDGHSNCQPLAQGASPLRQSWFWWAMPTSFRPLVPERCLAILSNRADSR